MTQPLTKSGQGLVLDSPDELERVLWIEAEATAMERERLWAEWDRLMEDSDWPFDATSFAITFRKLLAEDER